MTLDFALSSTVALVLVVIVFTLTVQTHRYTSKRPITPITARAQSATVLQAKSSCEETAAVGKSLQDFDK